MQINSNKYNNPQILEVLKNENQELKDCAAAHKNIAYVQEKIQRTWKSADTFLSSVNLGTAAGLTAGAIASMSPWAVSAIPVVVSAAASLGIAISPAAAPIIIGVGVGVGATILAAGVIISVVKINKHFKIRRLEKETETIKADLAEHKEEYKKWPVFNGNHGYLDVHNLLNQQNAQHLLTQQDIDASLTSLIAHNKSIIEQLNNLASKSKSTTEKLNKNHAVINFSCHKMLEEYAVKFEKIQQNLEVEKNKIYEPSSPNGVIQRQSIKHLIYDLHKLEEECQVIQKQRFDFFDKQIAAQDQYLQALKG